MDRRNNIRVLLLLLIAGMFLADSALADHFRFQHMTWRRTPSTTDDPRNIDITVTEGWRADDVGSFSYQVSSGGTILFSFSSAGAPEIASGVDISGAAFTVRQLTTQGVMPHDGPFLVENNQSTLFNCCRILGLVNASDESMRLSTTIDLRNGNQGSPVATTGVNIQMVQGTVNNIPLSIADPDGHPFTCRLSTMTESLIPSLPSAGGQTLSISSDCVLTWDTSGTTAGERYAAQVFIEENNDLADSSLGAGHTVVDFVIEIVPGSPNTAPTCSGTSGTHTVEVGEAFQATLIGADADGDPLTVSYAGLPPGATVNPAAGTTLPEPATATVDWTPSLSDAGSTHAVTVTFTDPDGLEAMCSFTIEVPEVNAPTCSGTSGTHVVEVGETFNATVTGEDADGDLLTVDHLGLPPGATLTPAAGTTVPEPAVVDFEWTPTLSDAGSVSIVTLTFTDPLGLAAMCSFTIQVPAPSQPPVISEVDVTPEIVAVGGLVAATGGFSTFGGSGTPTATWDWGDGTTSPGTVAPTTGGDWTATGDHSYSAAGLYTVTLTVDDGNGGTDSAEFEFVVVFDPNAGLALGWGGIDSPAGAYMPDPTVSGPASFGFFSKYLPGASVPTGLAVFAFPAAGLHFFSTEPDWLVITGDELMLQGVGRVNNQAGHGFFVKAISGHGSAAKFRIKIWELGSGETVYDNEPGSSETDEPFTELSDGFVKIKSP